MGYFGRRKAAFSYAFRGLQYLLINEPHMRIHACIAILTIIAAILLEISSMEWCLIVVCIGSVFMAEAFNTAIEKLSDKVSPERDPLIKIAKDVAAGAVLAISIASAVIGLIIFIPRLIILF